MSSNLPMFDSTTSDEFSTALRLDGSVEHHNFNFDHQHGNTNDAALLATTVEDDKLASCKDSSPEICYSIPTAWS